MEKVENLCKAAVKLGLAGIAVTDHCDVYRGKRECLAIKKVLIADVRRARDTFGDALDISVGLELGEPHHDPDLAGEITDDPELDFVIGSIHMMRDYEDFYHVDYDSVDLDYMYRKYYDELYEMSECVLYDVVGHINYQVRYMNERARNGLDLSVYYPKVSEILASALRHGIGIEINASGFCKGVGPLPSQAVLDMYKSLGGEIITSGSDAHSAARVGADLPDAMRSLAAAGFEKFAFFKGRKPVFHDIPTPV
jgi:histidinol-phosphatase (PHP family)